MINPTLANFNIELSDSFFPEELTEKYDNFLFGMNNPFKTTRAMFHESIQQLNIPGINIQGLLVSGLNNLGPNSINNPFFPPPTQNRMYEGNQPWWETLEDTKLNLTLRNNILNWMYSYEFCYSRYKRTGRVDQFQIRLTLMDSAEIPLINVVFSDCFISTTPGLEFAFNSSFNESKSIDLGIQFNDMDVKFNIPEFNSLMLNLNKTE